MRVTVTLETRPDGGLRIYSDGLPGLLLSGADPNKVMGDLLPAIEVLLANWTPTEGRRRGAEMSEWKQQAYAAEPPGWAQDPFNDNVFCTCGDCGAWMTVVRPGQVQCDNPQCPAPQLQEE